jgi:predicted membrane protein
MTEQIHRAKINKSNDRTNTQSEDKQVKWQNKYTERRKKSSVIWLVYLRSVYLFCHLTCLSSLCVFVLSFDLFIFVLCICSVIWLVYLRSVYLFCHLTCLSSLCVFVLSFDLFIFVLCICFVIWLVYLRSVYVFCNSLMTEQIHRAKINKSNDRTNTQSEDKQVKWQNKYTEWR